MKRHLILCMPLASALLLTGWLHAATEAELRSAASEVAATWDMSKQPRKFAAILIVRQEGKTAPLVCVGSNSGGRLQVRADVDGAKGELNIATTGSAAMKFTNTGNQPGAQSTAAAAEWAANLKDRPIDVEAVDFTDVAWTPDAKDKRNQHLSAKVRLKINAAGKAHTVDATAKLSISRDKRALTLRIEAQVDAAKLGLTGGLVTLIVGTAADVSPAPAGR